MSGKLIVVEGLDGSGKATQTALLFEALKASAPSLLHLTFPDYEDPSSALVKLYLNGELGDTPADVNAYAASSFYAVDRYASYVRYWKNAYSAGAPVIADRYTTSNLVYQLPKLPKEEWTAFSEWLTDYEYEKLGLPRPDLTLYLEMPETVSERLLSQRYRGDESKKDLHERDRAFQHDCREAAAFAAEYFSWRVIHCAEGETLRTPEKIHEEIMNVINKEL